MLFKEKLDDRGTRGYEIDYFAVACQAMLTTAYRAMLVEIEENLQGTVTDNTYPYISSKARLIARQQTIDFLSSLVVPKRTVV